MPTMKNRAEDAPDSNAGEGLAGTSDTMPSVGVSGTQDRMPRISGVTIPKGMLKKPKSLSKEIRDLLKSDKQKQQEAIAKQSLMPVKDM